MVQLSETEQVSYPAMLSVDNVQIESPQMSAIDLDKSILHKETAGRVFCNGRNEHRNKQAESMLIDIIGMSFNIKSVG